MEAYENVMTLRGESIAQTLSTLRKANRKAEQLMADYRPVLNGERLLTDAEVAALLTFAKKNY